MYIKSERFYQQPDSQPLKHEDRFYTDYDEELDERTYTDILEVIKINIIFYNIIPQFS